MSAAPRHEGIAASGGALTLLVCAVAAGMALQCALLAGRAVAMPRREALTASPERAAWPAKRSPAIQPAAQSLTQPAAREIAPARLPSKHEAMLPQVKSSATSVPAEIPKPATSREPAPEKASTTPRTAAPARSAHPAQPASGAAAAAPAGSRAMTAMGAPATEAGPFPTDEQTASARREMDLGAAMPIGPDQDEDVTPAGESGGTQVVVLGPARAQQGDEITFGLNLEGASGVAHAPLRVDFDPSVLRFTGAQEGTAFSQDGSATQFMAVPEASGGRIDIALSRMPPAKGLNGGGALCALHFTAIGQGNSAITVSGGRLMDSTGRAVSFRRNDAYVSIE